MIAEMKKITIAMPRSEREGVLQFLQEETAIHLIESEDLVIAEEEKSDTPYHLAQLQFALDFIARIKKELGMKDKRSFQNMFAGKPMAELPALEEAAQKIQIPDLISTVQQINDSLTVVDARLLEVKEALNALEPWTSLDLHAHLPEGTKNILIHHLLVITAKNEQLIEERLLQVPTAAWQVVSRTLRKKNVTVYGELIAHEDDAALVEAFEDDLDAILVTLPIASEESISGKHGILVLEENKLRKERAHLVEQAKNLFLIERDIRFAYDALLHRQERERVSETMRNSSYSTLFTGWIPTTWTELFSKRLSERFPDAILELSDPQEGDKAPVLFQNNSLVKPFEAVTDLYGKPAYHELDPTGPLALFFLISFGLALTDAGYGIVMMVVTFLAERFLNLKKDMQKMMRLLFFGGAMTVVLGALTGGWFSIDLTKLQEGPVKAFLLGVKVLDPLTQPILFLGIIFAFGVVQLMYAWVVRGIYHWKKGERGIAVMDDFAWTALVLTIVLSLASSKGFLPSSSALFFKWLMYAAFAFVIATQGRASKNMFLRIGGGILSLNSLIAFVSDMLSYSRLLALGLATGIIGLVVNLIASMVHESIPVVGVVLAGVVLLVGHVFNLGINALGAFIHSGRLQFVEFFPKFLEGGGVAFRPFGRVGKYVDNPKDFSKAL